MGKKSGVCLCFRPENCQRKQEKKQRGTWPYRGISTPGRQRISKSPKGWLPRMYWSGFPRERARHNSYRSEGESCPLMGTLRCDSEDEVTWSRNHRSSLRAESRSRHSRSKRGSSESIRRARRRSEVDSRGIHSCCSFTWEKRGAQ